jgi:hypothetical protein
MANDDVLVPPDPDMDLSIFLNKYKDENNSNENQFNIFDITSQYYELDQLSLNNTNHPNDQKNNFDYSTLHLNIHSLPAKIDNLKGLISELHEQNIEIDFILLCETFLTDFNSDQFDIPGYNFVYKNRINVNRGGVAIYVNSKHTFKMRDDLATNVTGIFESIFIEVNSKQLKAVVGEIYRVPNTNEVNSINMYNNII